MNNITKNPLYILGIIIRFAAIYLIIPKTHQEWFLPFMENALQGNIFNPWHTYLSHKSATPLAFPYGIVMYILLLPGLLVGKLMVQLSGNDLLLNLGFGLNLIFAETILLIFTCRVTKKLFSEGFSLNLFILLTWFSPVMFYICYYHGQLDVIPVMLLFIALYHVSCNSPKRAGLFLAMAATAKFSMMISVPFLIIYYLNNKKIRSDLQNFLSIFIITSIVLLLPVIISPEAIKMVLLTPESRKIFDISLTMREGLNIYILPLLYIIVLYTVWRIRRISFELLVALLGIGFFIVILLTPASAGWFLWVCPFLAIHQLSAERRQKQLVLGFSIIFVLFHLVQSSGAILPYFNFDFTEPLSAIYKLGQKEISIMLTMLIALGGIICFRIAMNGVVSNDFFRLSRKPLFIGIAGDSGSGKDTLAQSLIELFGEVSVAHVSGDDYHNWDRHKPMWQVLTHLNPEANDLEKYRQDCLSLYSGKSIRSRHYDHNSGKMTRPINVNNNDIIITSGLHALYSNALLEKYDVKIFLDMEEDLRRYLKINRDVIHRGHTLEKVMNSIEARENDRNKYIIPQKGNADIIIKIMPGKKLNLNEAALKEPDNNFKLEIIIKTSASLENIVKTLISFAGLEVDVDEVNGKRKIIINDTNITSEVVESCIRRVIPKVDDIIAIKPVWASGVTGIIHIFVLNQIVNSLRKRLV